MRERILAVILLVVVAWTAAAVGNDYDELGTIDWMRDYDAALKRAAREDKPVLILFQEVPGCATCRNYGLRVLSHPLLAEAAEELFVPLAVFNNRSGEDAQVLRLFGERSWNNPVVRIVDPDGRELTRRLAGDYSPGGFSGAMITALKSYGAGIPEYLNLAHTELSAAAGEETALFSMFCFWEGEIKLGSIPGVVATRAGYIGGSEVVEVRFDSRVLSYRQLLSRAAKLRCADRAFPVNPDQREVAERVLGVRRVGSSLQFRSDENTKYYLSKSIFRYLPMTETQKVRANIAIYENREPLEMLSPRQRQALLFIRRHPEKPWRLVSDSGDFRGDWHSLWNTIEEEM